MIVGDNSEVGGAPQAEGSDPPSPARRRLLAMAGLGLAAGVAAMSRTAALSDPSGKRPGSPLPGARGPSPGPGPSTGSSPSAAASPTSGPDAGPVIGAWSDPATWPSGKVPGRGDAVVIDRSVTLDMDAAVAGVDVTPAGHLIFAPGRSVTLETSRNVVVRGRLTLVPDGVSIEHVLRFVDIDEASVVGGGHEPLDTDVGLWVVADGTLRAEGTPRAGWNRSGSDPSWRPEDEILVAPMAADDTSGFVPFVPGSAVPVARGQGVSMAAEVFNLTRNVRIEGTPSGRAHIMFPRCTQPQTIRFVAIRHVAPAPSESADDDDVGHGLRHSTGRYGLHFHHCGDGSRGTIVEGVVIRDAGGHAFVPHGSHGITMRDCVAYGAAADAYWWDPEPEQTSYPSNATHDLLYEHCAAFDVKPRGSDRGFELAGFHLGQGERNRCIDCAVAGVGGSVNSSGFHWPSKANGMPNVWEFRGGVVHNNARHGIFVWQNDSADHLIEDFRAFNNGGSGVNHGAYLNRYRFRQLVLFDNDRGVTLHAGGRGGQPTVFTDVVSADPLGIAGHPIAFTAPARFVTCAFGGRIIFNGAVGGRPSPDGDYEFIDCTVDGHPVRPDDFDFVVDPVDTRIHVQNGNEAYELDADGPTPVDPITI